MNKLPIYLIVLFVALLNSCGRNTTIAEADRSSDSIYTRSFICQISRSDPERALGVADTAEMLNSLRTDHSSLDIMKSAIYYNGFRQPKLARYYALKAYEDPEIRKDSIAYMTNLINLVAVSQDSGDFEGSIRYATEGLEIIEKSGKYKGEEGKLLMRIAMAQHALGMDKEAKHNMMRAIAVCKKTVDKDPCWSNVQNLFYTMGETMNELDDMGDSHQAAEMIPDLLKTNALHESLESEAPEGIIDMYRFYTYAQCMEIYQHLGRRELADEYYRKCLATEFVKLPEGLNFLIPYQLWIKDYQLALDNLQIIKQSFLQNKRKETSFNDLLVNEMNALTGLGRYREATDVSRQLIARKDTLLLHQQRDAAQELAVIYETGEKDRQIQEEQGEKRLLLVLVVAVVVALGAMVYHNRQIRRRNVSLVHSVQEGIACRDKLLQQEEEHLVYKARIEMLERRLGGSTSSHKDNPESGATDTGELLDAAHSGELLRWVLHEIAVRELFRQPGITTKSVQEELCVPIALFGDSFKEQTGQNFTDYINGLRMDFAAKMLTQYPNYTVDAIAKMSGIDSRQHFHRLFSEFLGITPSAFRKGHISSDKE